MFVTCLLECCDETVCSAHSYPVCMPLLSVGCMKLRVDCTYIICVSFKNIKWMLNEEQLHKSEGGNLRMELSRPDTAAKCMTRDGQLLTISETQLMG